HKKLSGMNPFNSLPSEASPLGYPVLTEKREALQQKLLDEGVETLVHWPGYLLPEEVRSSFPDAIWLSEHLLTLPTHDQLDESDIRYVLDCISS
ncbi:MAG: DegT/DnrJ/EryC1/StrS family aminotransferase, partial [Fibrobacteres bacterium]|nr:DegT/DnrJ/EryC1/StrS family aminotransferase [Fibrobacterota bacterium]